MHCTVILERKRKCLIELLLVRESRKILQKQQKKGKKDKIKPKPTSIQLLALRKDG